MFYKNLKIHKIKNHSDMFRIVCDPSSGSIELYLAEIRSGSLLMDRIRYEKCRSDF